MPTLRQAAALLATAAVLSCGDDDPLSPSQRRDVVITRVEVTPDTASVLAGESTQLRALVFDQAGARVTNASVSWLTSDAQLAVVDRGVVSALAEGTVSITAVAGNAVGTATITIIDQSVPDVPSDLRAAPASNTAVDLSWSDNSKNEDEFRIERQAVAAGVFGADGADGAASSAWVLVGTSGKNQPNFRDSGLSAGSSYGYRVSACNANGCSTTTSETQTATHATLGIESTEVADGNVGTAYSQQLSATGGSGVYRWSASGSVPPGLTLAQSGRLSGTPTDEGDFSFTATVTSGGQEESRTFSLSIGPVLPPVITNTSLDPGVLGSLYAAYFKATQGDGSYAWTITEGTLPSGMTLTALGYLSGTPTETGQFDITVAVTSGGVTTAGEFTLMVYEPLTVPDLGDLDFTANAGESYSLTLPAEGGDGEYTWMTSGGTLPAGLTLSTAGVVSGVPTAAGIFSVSFRVTSGDGQTATRGGQFTIWPTITTPPTLPSAVIGTAYSHQLEHAGDGQSVLWEVDEDDLDELPPGITLSPDGLLSGTSTVAGTYSFLVWVTVTHPTGSLGVGQRFTLAVSTTSATIETTLLPMGFLGTEYAFNLVASGGEGAFDFTISAGSLPPGLTMDADGALSGTPTQAGMYPFGVLATSGDEVAFEILTITVSTMDAGAFNIRAIHVADEIPSQAVLDAVRMALARWEELVIGDVADATITAGSLLDCGGFDIFADGLEVDDLVILVNIAPIDGLFGTLGRAGPCSLRTVGLLPTTGVLTLDSEDLAAGTDQEARDISFHEMGHILGFGSLWDVSGGFFFPVLSGKSQSGDPDPRYIGADGVAQYMALGGTDPDIPVANTGGQGTADSHWRESTFGSEIMTGFIGPGTENPLSIMTLGAMSDMGYTVDLAAADDYSIPVASPPLTAAQQAQRGHDVVYRGPLLIHDRDGRTVRIIERY